MSEVQVTYFGWEELPEEIRIEYIERVQRMSSNACDKRDEFAVYELAKELYEEEFGR